ncbi:MAG: TonB-dependent receptor [Bacteroidales bacterium]|nr:TonB-dependent receptor [Bacteroidales bacterium]
MKIRNIVVTLFLLFATASVNAQSHNEEVTVEGSFTPHIKKSERVLMNPQLPKHEFNIPDYKVNTQDFFYNYKLDLEPVSPMSYNDVMSHDITNNFVKIGLGTRLSPDVLFRHYSDLTRNMSLGIGLTHNSTWTNMKDYDNSKYMNNAFNLSMNNKFSGFQLRTFIDYHNDMYNLKYSPDINTDDAPDTKRFINSLGVKLLSNNNQTSYRSLYDEFLLDYNFTGIQGGVMENLIKFNAYIEHSNSWFRNSDGIQTLSVDIKAELNNISQTLFIITANPRLDFDGEYYNLHLGFRVDAKTNSTSMGGIYPDIKGSLYLFNRNIEFYAGLGGKTKINTLKEILSENPFIISDLTNMGEFDYEKTRFDFQGGLKLKVLNMINGHVGVRYRIIENKVFYASSLTQPGAFDIILNNCHVFNFYADLHVKINDKIKVVGDFAYNDYDFIKERMTADFPVTIAHAWYKPKVEFALRGVYKYNDKWNFNIASYFEGKRYALTDITKYENEYDFDGVKELKPICDIQLGCDYNFNDDLSFYAEIKNLIHNKYQMYYGYPSYGFQAFLGFKYRF